MTQAVTLSGLGSTNALYTDSSGNVGIGTSSPASKLHVQNSTNGILVEPTGTWAAKIYQANDAEAYNGLVVGNRWASSTSTVFDAGSLYGMGSGSWKSFYKIDGNGTHIWGNNNSEAMRIASSGNVGIGTSSPQARLDINTTASGNILNVQGASGASAEINISLTGGTGNAEAILNFGNNLTTVARYVGRIAYSTSNNYMVFWTNTTERMRIDASGRVTKPYQPAFAVSMSGSGSRAANSVIPFDTALLNTGNYFNTSTYLFTTPVTGTYLFTLSLYLQGASSICYRINGAELGGPTPLLMVNSGAYDTGGSSQIIKYLSAGDTFGVYCRGTQASNVYGPHSMFCGYLLG